MKRAFRILSFFLFSIFLGGVSPAQADFPIPFLDSVAHALRGLRGEIYKGRVSFFDHGDCYDFSSRVYEVSPEQCNAFKRRFDAATGTPLSNQTSGPRPLTTQLELSYGYSPTRRDINSENIICPKTVVQSDRDGFFVANLQPCFKSSSPIPLWDLGAKPEQLPAPDLVKIHAILNYTLPPITAANKPPVIRALWQKDQIQPYYDPGFGPNVYTQADSGKNLEFIYPVFDQIVPLPNTKGQPKTSDLGVISFPNDSKIQASIIESIKMEILDWQTLMELHFRLRERLTALGHPEFYDQKIFIEKPTSNCEHCYTLFLNGTSTLSLGTNGVMILGAPAPNIIWSPNGMEYIIGHEFGHGIHYGFAPPFPNMKKGDRSFFGKATKPNGDEYGFIHYEGRVLDSSVAFVEGFATAMGQYLLHDCNAPWHTYFNNFPEPWNLETNEWKMDPSCDAEGNCSYHRFRWHMKKRGIAENSQEWNNRLAQVQALNNFVWQTYRVVTVNNEGRYMRFFCDLLSTNTDISHLRNGQRTDIPTIVGEPRYLDSYLYQLNRLLDGQTFVEGELPLRQYLQDVDPKIFHLNLLQILQAIDQFCPECEAQELPVLGDTNYGSFWLSAHSPLSPQGLGLYMVSQGWVSEADLNNVMRADFMEEVLTPPPSPARPILPSWKPQVRLRLSQESERWLEEIHKTRRNSDGRSLR